MPNSNSVIIHKLQRAINSKGEKLLVNRNQFYSETQDRPVTMYSVKKAIQDDGKNQYIELFKSCSEIQIVLFMRDYWYKLNGIELPQDNKVWNRIRGEIGMGTGTAPEL